MPHEQTQSNAYDDALVQIVALFDTVVVLVVGLA